jgi:phospholipase/carboxylesterase
MNLPLTHIWLPADTPSKRLMVVLHGLGDSADGFLWLQDGLGIDSLDYLLLTAPDPYYGGFRWYDIDSNSLSGVVRSRQLLAQVFATTEQNGYKPEHTFLLGFSQGCLMTLEFGARHSKRLAGYIGISGYSLGPAALLRDLNPKVNHGDWLITHGTQDEMLPVQVTRAQMRALREGGFKIDYREYPKTHTIDADRELPEIREWIATRLGVSC